MDTQTAQRLTLEEFERCRPMGGESGNASRAFCPFHGSDKQRSLRLNQDTGRFQCFACGVWGYLAKDDHPAPGAGRGHPVQSRPLSRNEPSIPGTTRAYRPPPRPAQAPRPPAPVPESLEAALYGYQSALPGSWGERYLALRGIPLTLAQRHGVGYATGGSWLHPKRDWKWGRLVFPHTDPAGTVLNLYGRAVGQDDQVPKSVRHDHLPYPKGFFNSAALQGPGPVHICEGPFDALSLIAAGREAVAIFGVDGWNWDWVRPTRELVLALDADEAGQRWQPLARGLLLRAKKVSFLELSCYGGCKDINEAWSRNLLTL